jgi:hypothetical protein
MKTQIPWRNTLHLHSTSLETFTREERTTSWCVELGAPPLIFIGVAPGGFGWKNSRGSMEPTLGRLLEAPRGSLSRLEVKLVQPNHQFGRTGPGANRLHLRMGHYLVGPCASGWWLGWSWVGFLRLWALQSMWCLRGSAWLVEAFLLGSKGMFSVYFQPNPCIHNFLHGHVECRGFISSMCIRNAWSSLFNDQIDAHFWSVTIVNKIPQATLCSSLSKVRLKLLIRSCCDISSFPYTKLTTKSSTLLWLSWIWLAHPFYLTLHGAFGFLLALGYWEVEWFIKHHLHIPCSTLHPEVFQQILQRKYSSSNDTLKSLNVYNSSPRLCVAFFFLFL